MPEQGRRIFATHRGTISKVIDVPLRYVYDWATDFRSDDASLEGAQRKHRVLRVGSRRLVRVKVGGGGVRTPRTSVEVVRLSPPDAWHKDTIGEEDLDSMDYKLTALGPSRTRLELRIVERWMVPKFPTKAEWLRRSNQFWNELVLEIEQRYRRGKPAKG